MSRFTTPRALAEHLGWNLPDVTEQRYQQHRNEQAIYTIGDSYMTACKVGKKPKAFEGFKWVKLDSWVTAPYSWEIYEAERIVE